LELFWSEEPFSTAAFFRGCGRYFWRFVRLALVCAILCVFVSIASTLLSKIGNKLWGEGSEETPLVYWNWFRVAVMLLLFGFVNLVSDYGRIHMVARDTRGAFRATAESIRFVLGNFGRTAGLYALIWVVLLMVLAVYRGIEGIIGQSTLVLALMLFVIRQTTALARVWMQLLFYSSETEMYRALAIPAGTPVLTPAGAEAPEPQPPPPEPTSGSPAPEPLQY
jgi:hypothetical protein